MAKWLMQQSFPSIILSLVLTELPCKKNFFLKKLPKITMLLNNIRSSSIKPTKDTCHIILGVVTAAAFYGWEIRSF
jgi:hypothetical protein